MPSNEARGVIDGALYFLLDGTRNVTGPTTIVNNVPLLASDVLTIRGAAGQTGKLLTLENSALADVFTVDVSGNVVTTGSVTAGTTFSGQTAALSHTLTTAQAFHYGLTTYVQSAASGAQTDMSGLYNTAYHLGSGLLSFLEGAQFYTRATGPVTDHYAVYALGDSRASVSTYYGGYIRADHQAGAISTSMTGLYVRANLVSGSVPTLVGVDVVVNPTGTVSGSTWAMRTVGGPHSFGGTVNINPAANTSGLVVSGASLTGSNAQALLSVSGTWNTSGAPTGILLNITNTASTSAKMLDLQLAGASIFSVDTNGDLRASRVYSAIFRDPANSNTWVSMLSNVLTFGTATVNSIIFASAANATILLSALTTLRVSDASTNGVSNTLTIGHNSTGTPAAGFGTGYLFQGESSTTENRDMGRVRTLWQTATDASRAADLILSAFNTTNEREGIRIRGGASGAELAFFGGTPAAKPSLGTWAGLTTDQKLDALRDALNTLSLASYS